MRFLTLSWDDGFKSSSLQTAEIFEGFGLRTEFNVIAAEGQDAEELPVDMRPGGRWGAARGDFELWNELQSRGHIVQPHGYRHANKSTLPFHEARDLILKCMDAFSSRLQGFEPAKTIFVFPYNASTPELETWLPSVVRALRTGPGPALNALPTAQTTKLTTTGWEDPEPWLDRCLAELMAAPEGWLIYNAHGLDGEGWGPMRSEHLRRMLGKLTAQPELQILPAREVLDRATRQHHVAHQPPPD